MSWWSIRIVSHDPPYGAYIVEADTHEQAIEKADVAMRKRWGSMAGTTIKYDVPPEPVPAPPSSADEERIQATPPPRS